MRAVPDVWGFRLSLDNDEVNVIECLVFINATAETQSERRRRRYVEQRKWGIGEVNNQSLLFQANSYDTCKSEKHTVSDSNIPHLLLCSSCSSGSLKGRKAAEETVYRHKLVLPPVWPNLSAYSCRKTEGKKQTQKRNEDKFFVYWVMTITSDFRQLEQKTERHFTCWALQWGQLVKADSVIHYVI